MLKEISGPRRTIPIPGSQTATFGTIRGPSTAWTSEVNVLLHLDQRRLHLFLSVVPLVVAVFRVLNMVTLRV